MKHFTPQQKHEILLEYQPNSRAHSFAALAARHHVSGGKEVVRRWYHQWDHTVKSLNEKHRSGRPRILTKAEVQHHIAIPIRSNNRSHKPIHYNKLQPVVTAKIGKNISVRTIQRYGKQQLKGRQEHGKKRTANECKLLILQK